MLSYFCLCPLCSLENTGVSLAPLQPDDDPLLAAVNLLESNWISIQEIFELVIRLFCITILYHNLLLFIDIFHI
jgi:hypothetical protein